jgi:hypothetical protein
MIPEVPEDPDIPLDPLNPLDPDVPERPDDPEVPEGPVGPLGGPVGPVVPVGPAGPVAPVDPIYPLKFTQDLEPSIPPSISPEDGVTEILEEVNPTVAPLRAAEYPGKDSTVTEIASDDALIGYKVVSIASISATIFSPV